MLMSKAIIVFLFVFIAKTSSALVKKSRRQVSNDYNHDCGTHSAANGMIYNGQFVSKGLWPWKVALVYSSKHRIYPSEYFCGGVIISQTFVITAAHCLHPKQKDRTKDADIVLIFGAHELNVTREIGAVSVPLLKSYIHENWNPDSDRYDVDIALLEIENPLTFSNLIKPICLWTGDIAVDSLNTNVGTVVGWGKTLNEDYSYVPLLMTVPIVDNEKCWSDKNELVKISSNRTFCGGPRDGRTTPCNGDSGSGLYLENKKKHYLKGLVSAIWNSCDATTYTVYTDIYKYTKWIRKRSKAVITRCYEDSKNGYSCEVAAHFKRGSDILNFKNSHLKGKTDNDVTFLNFENSTVITIPNFEKFNKLSNLKMWDVELNEITESSFTSCPNLTSLGLRHNNLTKLSNGVFKNLKNLIGLGVNCNPIVEIEQNAFQGLGNLQHLFMCATKLPAINEEVLHPLVGLKMLHLNHTLIETIHSNAFKSLIRLWYLNLEYGRLTSIDENIFKPLRSLQYLLLNNNLINYINEYSFRSLTKLKRLSLRENRLRLLSSSLFLSQVKLEQLSIKDNRICKVGNRAFEKMDSLTKLDARGNICVDILFQNAIDFGVIERSCKNCYKP